MDLVTPADSLALYRQARAHLTATALLTAPERAAVLHILAHTDALEVVAARLAAQAQLNAKLPVFLRLLTALALAGPDHTIHVLKADLVALETCHMDLDITESDTAVTIHAAEGLPPGTVPS